MSKLTYIRCGDYDIPNLKLSEQPETSYRQVRQNAKILPKGTSPHSLQPSADEREAVSAPDRD